MTGASVFWFTGLVSLCWLFRGFSTGTLSTGTPSSDSSLSLSSCGAKQSSCSSFLDSTFFSGTFSAFLIVSLFILLSEAVFLDSGDFSWGFSITIGSTGTIGSLTLT